VLDTGVGLVLITDPQLLNTIGKEAKRSITINGIGEGDEMVAMIQPHTNLQIENSISGDISVAILKEDPFDLSSYVGMPIHGLIGYELFSSFIIRINYSSKVVTYHENSSPFKSRRASQIPISIEDKKPYLQSIVTLPNGSTETVKLIIDSGAGHPLSLETKQGQSYEVPPKHIRANLGVGLSGAIHGYISRIPMLMIGPFQLKEVLCAFPDFSNVAAKAYAVSRNGNLGNNVLKRFEVVFDYRRNLMLLTRNFMFKEPFEHDMSGMELSTSGERYEKVFITRIEPGSAAEKAGFSPGDRIISVNFKKIENLTVEDVNALLRSKENRTIIFEISSVLSKEIEYKVLTLKRRI
jgi:hypothetical protein